MKSIQKQQKWVILVPGGILLHSLVISLIEDTSQT